MDEMRGTSHHEEEAMRINNNRPPKPGPRLQALLDSGVICLSEYGNYLAVASDGVGVCISGPLYETSDVQRTEAYLTDHPGPEDW